MSDSTNAKQSCACAAAGHSGGVPDTAIVDALVSRIGGQRRHLVPLLQAIQAECNYLPPAMLERLAAITGIRPADISGVATFFNQFRHRPTGRHLVKVCHGTACHVAGAQEITDAARRALKLAGNSDTDSGMEFTLVKVACLGCCSLAPAMQIDDVTYGHLTPGTVHEALEDFRDRCASAGRGGLDAGKAAGGGGRRTTEFRLGLGSCCLASGSDAVLAALESSIAGLGAAAVIRPGSCVGMCHRVPLLDVRMPGGETARYGNVTAAVVPEIVRRHTVSGKPLRRLAAATAVAGEWLLYGRAGDTAAAHLVPPGDEAAGAFLAPQRPVVLEGAGSSDPLDLEEYRRQGGFRALELALRELSPGKLTALIRDSGLRGRGGAGFPSGRKWAAVRAAPGKDKYVVCNGDEGDPGAFMDRMILESYPYRVLEGMLLAAYAVGARHGGLYVRAEYGLAGRRLEEALARLRAAGLLGADILGKGFSLELELHRGAGAFVSGEETALLAAVEGRRATPRFRPPYPAERGLWDKPTLINNVETFACVPWIVRNGAAAFSAHGTAASRGTKVFALAGRIRRGGLIEVPMGITLRTIVEQIGGGIRDGRGFKAVQVGGPSGGCIPASLADTPVDYESLTAAGSIMGSGGMVVLDDRTCMVDMARYFLRFTQEESCGQCTFCRIGTKRMLEILDRLCAGKGAAGDLELLTELAAQVRNTSLCGLGRTAPNPVLSTLRYFRSEYEAHIAGHCPAGVCRDLIAYSIGDKCIGCTICAQKCPVQAIAPMPHQQHKIDQAACIRCGTCRRACPVEAVDVR